MIAAGWLSLQAEEGTLPPPPRPLLQMTRADVSADDPEKGANPFLPSLLQRRMSEPSAAAAAAAETEEGEKIIIPGAFL